MKTVAPNFDKPHRCPLCHRIPDVARKDGFAISNKTYECKRCDVRWITPTHYIHIHSSELDGSCDEYGKEITGGSST
jgi:hypothetical protein